MKKKINPDYVFFYTQTRSYKNWVKAIQRVSGQPNINAEEYKSLLIPLPDRDSQEKIIGIFKNAFSLQNQNRKKSKNLIKSLVSLLSDNNVEIPHFEVKSPQFNYVLSLENALNVERYAFTFNLDNPKNWQTIKEAGEVKLQTLTPSDDLNKDKSFTLLRIDDLPNKPFKPVSRSVQGSEVEGNVQYIKTNDVLVARLAPTVRNKKIIVAPESELQIIGSNEFIRFTCNEENNAIFVCYLLRTAFYTELMLSKSRGSTPSRYRLSRADFEKLPFPKVPKETQDEIAAEYLKNIEEAQRLIKEGKEAVKKAKKEVEEMILGEVD